MYVRALTSKHSPRLLKFTQVNDQRDLNVEKNLPIGTNLQRIQYLF